MWVISECHTGILIAEDIRDLVNGLGLDSDELAIVHNEPETKRLAYEDSQIEPSIVVTLQEIIERLEKLERAGRLVA